MLNALLTQEPFVPKDWSSSLPAWLIAFAFLISLGVWTAKQLKEVFGNGKKPPEAKRELTSGEVNPEVWHDRFDEIEQKIESAKMEHISAIRDLTKAINDLTMTLLRGK